MVQPNARMTDVLRDIDVVCFDVFGTLIEITDRRRPFAHLKRKMTPEKVSRFRRMAMTTELTLRAGRSGRRSNRYRPYDPAPSGIRPHYKHRGAAYAAPPSARHTAQNNADRSYLDALRLLLVSGPRTNTIC